MDHITRVRTIILTITLLAVMSKDEHSLSLFIQSAPGVVESTSKQCKHLNTNQV